MPDDRVLDVVVAEHGDLAGARAAAASISSASASFGAIGFSHQTCLPAASAAIAISRWNLFGVVIETTSTSGSAITVRQSPDAFSKPNSAAFRLRQLVVGLAEMDEPDRGHVAEDRPAPHSRPAHGALPMKPVPMSPTPIVFMHLLRA